MGRVPQGAGCRVPRGAGCRMAPGAPGGCRRARARYRRTRAGYRRARARCPGLRVPPAVPQAVPPGASRMPRRAGGTERVRRSNASHQVAAGRPAAGRRISPGMRLPVPGLPLRGPERAARLNCPYQQSPNRRFLANITWACRAPARAQRSVREASARPPDRFRHPRGMRQRCPLAHHRQIRSRSLDGRPTHGPMQARSRRSAQSAQTGAQPHTPGARTPVRRRNLAIRDNSS